MAATTSSSFRRFGLPDSGRNRRMLTPLTPRPSSSALRMAAGSSVDASLVLTRLERGSRDQAHARVACEALRPVQAAVALFLLDDFERDFDRFPWCVVGVESESEEQVVWLAQDADRHSRPLSSAVERANSYACAVAGLEVEPAGGRQLDVVEDSRDRFTDVVGESAASDDADFLERLGSFEPCPFDDR